MDLHFSKLKRVALSYRCLISGYCREIRTQLLPPDTYHDVLPIMQFAVLAYYHDDEIDESESETYNVLYPEASAPSERSFRSKRTWEVSTNHAMEMFLQPEWDYDEAMENPDVEKEEILLLQLNLWHGKYSKKAFKIAMALQIV